MGYIFISHWLRSKTSYHPYFRYKYKVNKISLLWVPDKKGYFSYSDPNFLMFSGVRGCFYAKFSTEPPHRRLRKAASSKFFRRVSEPPHRRLRNLTKINAQSGAPEPPHRRLRKRNATKAIAQQPEPPHRRLRNTTSRHDCIFATEPPHRRLRKFTYDVKAIPLPEPPHRRPRNTP